jgi:hypothetical protein
MKTKLFVLIGLFFFSTITYSQQQVINAAQKEKALQTPRELLWLTLNKTTFFPSEYLYFNGYLLDAENLEASTVSQIIYLRLISADGSYSEIKRVALSDGFGSGDWFISSDLATGSYTLQAYSQWMLNWPESIFEQEIHVINPYTNAKVKAEKGVLRYPQRRALQTIDLK